MICTHQQGESMVIQSNSEQAEAARSCGDRYCCLGYIPGTWTWEIQLLTNDRYEADYWWETQPKMARVYYSSGKIRNAR